MKTILLDTSTVLVLVANNQKAPHKENKNNNQKHESATINCYTTATKQKKATIFENIQYDNKN
jgi:PIN domain nuclease of toxin-antitoxin system